MNVSLLLEQLAALPPGLALVAVGGNKAPYQPRWQQAPLTKTEMTQEVQSGRCRAIGVLAGPASGGLVFVDHDGHSCDRLIKTLSGLALELALPRTVGIASGRPGHYQLLYRVPEQYWSKIQTRKVKTGTASEDGKAEILELRWQGCQSIVAGCHPITGTYHYLPGLSFAECEIAIAPDWLIQQMRTEPTPTLTWSEFDRQFSLPIHEAVPLESCLSRTSRELLNGVSQGNRDNSGAKLARDLLGTARYLEGIGQGYTGNPQNLLENFCCCCSPPLTPKDSQRLWRSALKDHPGPSLPPDQIERCIKRWQWQQCWGKPPEQAFVSSTISTPHPTRLENLQQQIREFVADAPTETQLTAQVIAWITQTGKSERSIWALVKSIQAELEHQLSRQLAQTELSHLSRLADYQPSLGQYLHPWLAQPLEKLADWMGTTGMAMLTTLLPVCGSLLPVGTELELNSGTEYRVYPILYTGIVAESGSGKSPAQKTILKPLFRLQAEAEAVYQETLSAWEQENRRAKEQGEPTPSKPKPKDYFTTDATREAVVQMQANQPNCGFLGWFDELSALIRGQNQYRSGRGTDKESLLSGRDGSAQKVDRAGGKRLFIARSAYSITGSTQPDTLRALMGDFSDPSGQWARFLWCFLPVRPAPYPDHAVHLDIAELLYSAYQRLTEVLVLTYQLSPAAREHYITWYNELDHLRLQEVKQSLRAVYAKFKSDTGVLALILHCLNAAIAWEVPSEQVSASTMLAAIRLSKFYLGQVKLIHSEGDVQAGDLTPGYFKILSLSHRKGWITARDIYRARAVTNRHATLDQIRELMRELVTMGLAESRNQGNRLEIRALAQSEPPQPTDDVPSTLDEFETDATGFVTNGHPTVTTNGQVVTTLSPEQKSDKALFRNGFSAETNPVVTTVTSKPTHISQARPPNYRHPPIRAGDICQYRGPAGAMQVTCWGKDLKVLSVTNGIATVKADRWVYPHQIPISHLQRAG
jgi:hypothetical protein